jgi:hypothetical protein
MNPLSSAENALKRGTSGGVYYPARPARSPLLLPTTLHLAVAYVP